MNTTEHEIHYRHWKKHHQKTLKKAGSNLALLRDLALDVTTDRPPGMHMICGPMTTGGVGNTQDNLRIFRRVIEHVTDEEGLNVFSQMPFEDGMVGYHNWWVANVQKGTYCWPILLEFYQPLFASRQFDTFHFIHGYEASVGARWEHEQCRKHGFKIRYLPKSLSTDLLRSLERDRLKIWIATPSGFRECG